MFDALTLAVVLPVPPVDSFTLAGLKATVRLVLLACPVRNIVPEKPWVLRIVTIVVPFAPWGTEIEVGLSVSTKPPVVL